MINQPCDIAIVGAGMVGGALALGLARRGFTVTVIEKNAPPAFSPSAIPDTRVSAISLASVSLLTSLGVWESIQAMRVHPWRRLETWEWETARVVFDAAQLKLPLLGYMAENNVLRLALWQALQACPQVTLRTGASLSALRRDNQRHLLTLDNGDELSVTLVVGADGAHSQVRRMAGIGVHGWQYRQSCMLIIARGESASGDNVWQQFTPAGPRAFLPLFDNWVSLAWYDSPARIRQLLALDMALLRQQIEKHFPARVGNVTPVAASAFPLTRRHALQYVQPGRVLVGDAAHTIHPLAGQGVNLGWRDVAVLLEVLTRARDRAEAWSDYGVLKCYQTRRMADNFMMQGAMDLFYAGFSNDLMPVRVLRNAGLMVAQRADGLKRLALKYASGL